MRRSAVVTALMLVVACGDDLPGPPVDAGPCWPLPATPGGRVELGTGSIAFEPLPSPMPIIANGSQADPFLELFARIHDIPPGDPLDFFDPANPRTKMTVTVPALGLTLGVPCPASIGYVQTDEPGVSDLPRSLRVGIGVNPIAEFADQQAEILVEVVGSNGLYARDQKTVTLSIPPSPVDAGVDALPSD